MILQQKPMFKRAYKKLTPNQQARVKEEVRRIVADPTLGVEKKQDLKGIFVHKFKISTQQYLLAYMFDPETLTLVFIGVHENYYRNLKNYLN